MRTTVSSVATTLVLVRHGETDWNRVNRFQGHADQPLNEAGRSQARELAEQLAGEPFAALYTSPLKRASETADIVGTALGLEAQRLDALLEIDVGAWEGLTIDEVRARYPDRADENWRSGWEDGETYEELENRVLPALLELGSRHDGEQILAVTHAGPLRAAIAASMALSHHEARPLIGPLANCVVYRFAIQDGSLEQLDGPASYDRRVSLPPDSNRLEPDHLPTPFSAADIRAGCPLGRTIRLQTEAADGELSFRRIRFVEVDADGAVQEFESLAADGQPIGDPTLRRSSWLDLQQHATQPAATTVLDEVDLTTPLGTEACWRYTVGSAEDGVTFWFAKRRPGMPVQVEERAAGELVSRSIVIEDEVGSVSDGSAALPPP
jgi:broad specificity phosphatase PhoE